MDSAVQPAADEEKPPEYKYWAFISYSHQDEPWAAWLHKGLETYGVPPALGGAGRKRFSGTQENISRVSGPGRIAHLRRSQPTDQSGSAPITLSDRHLLAPGGDVNLGKRGDQIFQGRGTGEPDPGGHRGRRTQCLR